MNIIILKWIENASPKYLEIGNILKKIEILSSLIAL